MLNSKVYDVLKYVVMIGLPALSGLYVALAGIWGWPYAEAVAGSVDAVCFCLGTMLMISTAQYNKGVKLNG